MTTKITRPARKAAAVLGMTTLMAIVPLVAAPGAEALGDNRTVTRSCGKNHVSSGLNNGKSWAQTEKESGTCAGRLSAALELVDGYRIQRVYGTKSRAYASFNTGSGMAAKYGLHWGCDNCNVTKS
ncbi:hypothetical protein CUT44_22840 [Streptomyces carminius]|uniref:Uncharacterized protein n=1 Tax=Streptomyces carminius TaxID=2665496 RepID=A0A2M8LU20_9ACTN|nr:hypothetical protein [Streptomyces carminius]PJE95453.1 hypothetical protein CUT44_22840 [Streptomyces carminius]